MKARYDSSEKYFKGHSLQDSGNAIEGTVDTPRGVVRLYHGPYMGGVEIWLTIIVGEVNHTRMYQRPTPMTPRGLITLARRFAKEF